MTAPRTLSSSIEVAVDPATAFEVFTEELDCWWLQGPINFFDSARLHSMRMEPRVGGRIVEVYDEETGDGLELARITVWEPGERVSMIAANKANDVLARGSSVREWKMVSQEGPSRNQVRDWLSGLESLRAVVRIPELRVLGPSA